MRLLRHRDNLLAVGRKREQGSCAPDTDNGHECPGKGLFPCHTDPAATHAGAVVHNALPGDRQGQRMAL
ncbi:hypothetical protein NB724_004251 [Pantoea ananatis]|nr:hypothetical protein [Pantoea ananatis]MCW0337239.1 hypothetical protein [Pantoea ananatis]MCW0385424.1 hypothetical protein [Pantoea ananatis]MCW0410087.1 hypothetical protein [Pantoea ananatis]MCW0430254.1 hypothetical protein [Pantoea ananatis]